ncbi:SLC13 family permease [Altererythrobacter endophyticus]|uniref:SLC13 family permease n=2 Tax=Altericroceibacterium endophyticum TaxID=1808508 RepID=A0A6I4T3S7_9SPHN|nr:SLC13 family permease [Altericroceibacterium endophyticum]MXO64650.1 SLC13 family permease [Altericroceibacterium endophyticum]
MPGIPSFHAMAAMLVTVAMFIGFARSRLSTEIVSLLVIAVIAVGLYFFPLPGTGPTDGLVLAFSGFGHYALITICALMIMGRGLVVTGALEPAARVLERVWKVNHQLGLLVSLLLAFGLSMIVNDTPVLVLLLPIFVSLAARGAMPASKTLIPLNAAVLIGGMATTIGTSTNLLVVSIARDLGMPPMNVFHFTPIVFAAALVAIPYLWLVMPKLLPDNSQEVIQSKRRFITRLRVPAGSDLVGKHLNEVLERLPDDFRFEERPSGPFEAGQRLRVSGTHDGLQEALRVLKGQVAPGWVVDRIRRDSSAQGEDVRVAEMVITADSRLIRRTLATSGIADLYGVAILGIHKPDRLLNTQPADPRGDIRLAEGDVLLVMGLPDALEDFARTDSLLMLQGAQVMPRRSKALLSTVIMFLSVGSASIGFLPIAIAALGGAILMFITGCVKFDKVGRALSAKVIVLVAASIAIGRAILESGAADWLGQSMAAGLQYLPPAAILAAIMLFVTTLTNFASNATAATVGTPIAFSIANQLGLPQEPLILAVLFGCNLCYATPIAYQTNMLIMAEGDYSFGDYLRTGVPLVVLMVATLSGLLVLTYGM